MQKDFHFYATYVLCRCNGMSPDDSKIVAYASQHTDDAAYDHALSFKNGGRFQQVLSAHRFLHPDAFSLDAQYKIYVPFHFIPGIRGKGFQENMVCMENSESAQQMVREISTLKGKPYLLHRFGIALHAYADTWSHHSFSGLQTDINDIEDIHVVNESRAGIAKIFRDFLRGVTEALIPHIGHAETATLPDEPYREWRFYQVYQKETIQRKNWLIFQNAGKALYREIESFLMKNPQYRVEKSVPWGNLKVKMTDLFKQKDNLEERCRNWTEIINDSGFGFVCQPAEKDIVYDDREWFRKAVEVRADKEGKKRYYRKENFHFSDWKCFHDAATSHRFFVLEELLSSRGIICG
ncbi:MAG: DUF6765 family protein [Pseudomonadota bacterium]